MTKLSSPVTRMSEALVRDSGKLKRLVVTLYPNDTIGLRPEKTRREEVVAIGAAYSLAVKQRVNSERIERKKHHGNGKSRR
jgi:hypothetical protein